MENQSGAGKRVLASYGGMTVLLSFLNTLEQLKLQALNKWAYTVAISRVQVTINLATQHFFTSL